MRAIGRSGGSDCEPTVARRASMTDAEDAGRVKGPDGYWFERAWFERDVAGLVFRVWGVGIVSRARGGGGKAGARFSNSIYTNSRSTAQRTLLVVVM